MTHDVIILGGSYAGLSAGLQLARARRSVLVIDTGMRRNRFAATSHGFLTQDGSAPAEIAAEARSQLMEYRSVEWLQTAAISAERVQDGFKVALQQGPDVTGKRLVLATGVTDVLPDLDGLAERWGRSVFHCPYCHGYELDQGRIGVLATSPLSMHQALMLPDWGPTTFFLNGAFEPDADQLQQLAWRNVTLEHGLIDRIEGERVDVVMKDGRVLPMDGIFTTTRTVVSAPFSEQLGCTLDDGPLGRYIRTDAMKATTVPGVFACGDAARPTGSVALAVGDGAMAGAATHRSLMFD
ncbi:FAD-dependent oxidoreductase [Ensifer sp. T173]|uniref:Thioredoxin reductase n=1 Tax=Ensifer canadensis TaxID=555315 RepID=A0AAW4FS49_9HYPH|nr:MULTISPECIES: NAD(P)/FAD-dependent oxidoreductase [Ensifer]MDP9633272.1 thioredoxin reductase [Ensifer adhaerens]KQY69928.1 thioredoxin reductase [Ensifer sp. Root142]MBD9490715.1 NAD(P)/FAD-dependent oxidoreductase [Ensifer sp. ENS11]MBM3094103.1 FAD-dependent oxidoreductase [Ensifer canadensis]PSS62840.1 NAD(P)/FAD-dependent oxidoreductase [Ensifer sp. NM-2]